MNVRQGQDRPLRTMGEEVRKQVFISYSSQDRVVAEALLTRLEQRGIRCWIAPRDIAAGESFSGAIIDALNRARVMVLVFSANSNVSKHCLAEVERAFSRGIPIVSFRLEDLFPSRDLEYFLSTSQWLNAFSDSVERHAAELEAAIRPLLEGEGTKTTVVTHGGIIPFKGVRRRRWLGAAVLTLVAAGIAGSLFWRTWGTQGLDEASAARLERAAQDLGRAEAALKWVGVPEHLRAEVDGARELARRFRQARDAGRAEEAQTLGQEALAAHVRAAVDASPGEDASPRQLKAGLRAMLQLGTLLPTDSSLAGQVSELTDRFRAATAIENSLGMRLLYIPPGRFLMGSDADEDKSESDDDENQHLRAVDAFYIQEREVTKGQFAEFVEETDYQTDAERRGMAKLRVGTLPPWQEVRFQGHERAYVWRTPLIEQDDGHPVVLVTWNDAVAFTEWLSEREGRLYRLPSEAEWEYACRAGTETPFHTGLTITAEQANFCADNAGYPRGTPPAGGFLKTTAPVGSYLPNRFGLYDMHGNVWEWCQDPYSRLYPGMGGEEDDLVEFTSEYVRRGGGWASSPVTLRSANRWKLAPDYPREDSGFRVVLVEGSAHP